MIPHLTKCVEARICAQSHNIDYGVQFIGIVRLGGHDHQVAGGERLREIEREQEAEFWSLLLLTTNLEVMFAI